MKFHAVIPVRDEGDVILESLTSYLRWADYIHIFDTGSVDDTWNIVLSLARKEPRIVPIGSETVYFRDTLVRAYIFDRARKYMDDGDWFVRADADEFHHIAPPDFVRNFMKRHETAAWHQYYDFCLTRPEVDEWERSADPLADRQRPIQERRRHYTMGTYSEPRLCRYRRTMQWPEDYSFPVNAGFVAEKRLPIRHYPHRDPLQLRRRCLIRAAMMADPENRRAWTRADEHHWSVSDWRRFVTPDNDPNLRYWAPGTELPSPEFTNHLRPPKIRVVQRILHAAFLPLVDRFRRPFPSNVVLQRIPAEIQERLALDLSRMA